jgi:hypothetical protein
VCVCVFVCVSVCVLLIDLFQDCKDDLTGCLFNPQQVNHGCGMVVSRMLPITT